MGRSDSCPRLAGSSQGESAQRPAWKNKHEAAEELRRVVSEHEGGDHASWAGHVGQKKRLEFTAASGKLVPELDRADDGRRS